MKSRPRAIEHIDMYTYFVDPETDERFEVDDVISYIDMKAQIRENQESGWQIFYGDDIINVDKNGRLSHYPKGFLMIF